MSALLISPHTGVRSKTESRFPIEAANSKMETQLSSFFFFFLFFSSFFFWGGGGGGGSFLIQNSSSNLCLKCLLFNSKGGTAI